MEMILERLRAIAAYYVSVLSADINERKRFRKQREEACSGQPGDTSMIDALLASELEERTAILNERNRTIQVLHVYNAPV